MEAFESVARPMPRRQVHRPHTLIGCDHEWATICEERDRLNDAQAAGDQRLVVGCAKDLCESIAKVVIGQRGAVPSDRDDFDTSINAAHRLLKYQPGDDFAGDEAGQRVAQALKGMVMGVNLVRDRHGTGHGRGAPTGLTGEHVELAVGAASMWCRWALRRLESFIQGDPSALVRDLEEMAIFRRGSLAKRLQAANLSLLDADEQRRIGLAVARRAMTGTAVIRLDGISAVDPSQRERWPTQYVAGVIWGLMLDPNGRVWYTDWGVDDATRLAFGLPHGIDELGPLADRVELADLAYRVSNQEGAAEALAEAFDHARDWVPDGADASSWERLRAGVLAKLEPSSSTPT